MARTRQIKPQFFANEDLAECDLAARLLFVGLLTEADREGHLEDRPKRIKARLFAYDSFDVEPLLEQLAARGFIVRYEVAGARYIAIPNFKKHQHIHRDEQASVIPEPGDPGESTEVAPENYGASTALAPDNSGASTEVAALVASSLVASSLVDRRSELDNSPTGEIPASPAGSLEVFEAFEALWTSWPKRNGRRVGKGEALKVFKRLKPADWSDLKLAAANYAEYCLSNGQHPKDLSHWLANATSPAATWREFTQPPDNPTQPIQLRATARRPAVNFPLSERDASDFAVIVG